MAAIAHVKANEIKKLKEINREEASVTDEEGLTPLHWAARNGTLPIVIHLVELGVGIFSSSCAFSFSSLLVFFFVFLFRFFSF